MESFINFIPLGMQYPGNDILWIKSRKNRFYGLGSGGGPEFAGPENDGPKKIKGWKMQDLQMTDLETTDIVTSDVSSSDIFNCCRPIPFPLYFNAKMYNVLTGCNRSTYVYASLILELSS